MFNTELAQGFASGEEEGVGLTLSLTARYFVLRDRQSLRDWSSMSCALFSSLCRALLLCEGEVW